MSINRGGSGIHVLAQFQQVLTQVKFTPPLLDIKQNYTLFVTPGVTDSVFNPITGNSPNGSYVLSFSTTGGMYTNVGDIGANFGTGNAFPAFVLGSQPAPGKQSVARNTKVFVTFSEAMQNFAGNLANVKLYKVTSPFTSSESKSL